MINLSNTIVECKAHDKSTKKTDDTSSSFVIVIGVWFNVSFIERLEIRQIILVPSDEVACQSDALTGSSSSRRWWRPSPCSARGWG